MAGVSEKARFYLEKAVPQLREWEEKDIFTKDEIRTIVQKRSDFEHQVLAPGNTAANYQSYIDFEKSLQSLLAKRLHRLRIRHLTSQHTTQTKLLSLYDRGVNRHPSARNLWVGYLEYASSIKATKRWRVVATRALRMRPTDAALWVMCARRLASGGDMASARRFFMRACRFCNQNATVWVEYARCEMQWLSRLAAEDAAAAKQGKEERKAIAEAQTDADDHISIGGGSDDESNSDDEIVRSECTSAVFSPEAKSQLSNPAMQGALPAAIFSIAKAQSFWKSESAELFFDMFSLFRDLPITANLLQQVENELSGRFKNTLSEVWCRVMKPVAGVSVYNAEFARGLREVVGGVRETLAGGAGAVDRKAFGARVGAWADTVLEANNLDEGIKTVVEYLKTLGATTV